MAKPMTAAQRQVLHAILQHIRRNDLPADAHIREAELTALTGTSRSPVRVALEHLVTQGIVRHDSHRGHFLAVAASDISTDAIENAAAAEDTVYPKLAQLRHQGQLPAQVTEAGLVRRLGEPRARIRKALERAQEEGWAERRVGYGWEFPQVADSLDSYSDLYEVRIALEPACILSPKFKPNKRELDVLRAEQKAIAESEARTLTAIELFEANARFHATIAAWSHNHHAIQILKRLDRIRRLAEYHHAARPLPRREFAEDHCAILDAIEDGDTVLAASLLKTHLDAARRRKAVPAAFEQASAATVD